MNYYGVCTKNRFRENAIFIFGQVVLISHHTGLSLWCNCVTTNLHLSRDRCCASSPPSIDSEWQVVIRPPSPKEACGRADELVRAVCPAVLEIDCWISCAALQIAGNAAFWIRFFNAMEVGSIVFGELLIVFQSFESTLDAPYSTFESRSSTWPWWAHSGSSPSSLFESEWKRLEALVVAWVMLSSSSSSESGNFNISDFAYLTFAFSTSFLVVSVIWCLLSSFVVERWFNETRSEILM